MKKNIFLALMVAVTWFILYLLWKHLSFEYAVLFALSIIVSSLITQDE
jgi:hypothetical protein